MVKASDFYIGLFGFKSLFCVSIIMSKNIHIVW